MKRIAHPQYKPTPEDIVQAHLLGFRTDVHKVTVRHDSRDKHLIDFHEYPIPESSNEAFSIDVQSFPVFFYNLEDYRINSPVRNETILRQHQQLVDQFEKIISSEHFKASLIILASYRQRSGQRVTTSMSGSESSRNYIRGLFGGPTKARHLHIQSVLKERAHARGIRVFSRFGTPRENMEFVRSITRIFTTLEELVLNRQKY